VEDGYLLDNRSGEAGPRFDALGELFNPTTFGHIERLGIVPGWRCWEVGVGGPSVPAWLAQRVGPDGWVVATDIDIRWADAIAGPNVRVLHHDVAVDEPPETRFDLVHERLVLIHVERREEALRRMAGALRPGGWLLVEDFDSVLQPYACPDAPRAGEQLANRVRAGFRSLLVRHGADLELGRRLPRLLREIGLVDVEADARMAVSSRASSALEIANVRQVRDELVDAGHASRAEVDEHLRAVSAGDVQVSTALLVSAWGRRP
jgi:SAM-dependent methyltransferase